MNRHLSVVLAGIFCLFAAQTYLFVLIPLTAAALGLPGVQIGLLVGVPAGLGVVTDILVATVSDAIGRRAPVLVGALLGVLSGILLASASDFVTLLVGALVFGLSMSLSIGSILAYVTEASSSVAHARVQGYNGAVQGFAALGGALLVGAAVDRFGVQTSALLGSVLMAAAAVFAYRLAMTVPRRKIPRSPRHFVAAYASAARMLATRPPLQLAGLVSLLYSSVVFVIGNAFLPVYIVRDLGESAVLAGALLGARNLAMALSSPLFGRSVERFGLLATLFGACGVAVLGVVLMVVSASPAFLLVALVLQGIGIGFTPAICNILITSATERGERALGFATNGLASRSGSLLAPLAFGAILQFADMRTVFLAASVLGLGYLVAMAVRAITAAEGVLPVHGRVAAIEEARP